MTIHPRTPKDLLLAPVAAEVDLNLRFLRDEAPAEIDARLAVAFNIDTTGSTREQRTAWVLEDAVRGVELHEWTPEITDDAARLRLSGGSVSVDLGLSASLTNYITDGV